MSSALTANLEARIQARLASVAAPHDVAAVRRLTTWVSLHAKWSRVANLTGTRDETRLLTLHLADCAAVVPLLPMGRVLDVGSGAGLPGLVIAALQPERPVVLLDAVSKRTRFLEQAVLELELRSVSVVTARCEAWPSSPQAPLACVVARALAPLWRLVTLTRHLLVGGVPLLAMKGPAWRKEADTLPAGFRVASVTPYDVPGAGRRERVLMRIEREGEQT